MPTITKYVEVTEDQIKAIASYIQKWIDQTGCTHEQFADRYDEIVKSRFEPGSVVPMNRFRVLSFLNLARGSSSTRVAKVLRCREIEVISQLISIPVEVLIGHESESTLRLINAASSHADAATFLQLMRSHQPETKELIGWAEFLPCSLTTPEFMHAHHEALFPKNPGDVSVWDGIGNTRRNEFLSESGGRKWRMTQLNFLSDLKRIARGEREYANVPAPMRKMCLNNLARLLSDPQLAVRMFIADDDADSDAKTLRVDLRHYDSVITWDEKLMIVRDHWGIGHYSEKLRYTKYWRGIQEEFMQLAKFSKPDQVIGMIRNLSEGIPGKGQSASPIEASGKDGANLWARQQ